MSQSSIKQAEKTVRLIDEIEQAQDDIEWHKIEMAKCLETIDKNRAELVNIHGEDVSSMVDIFRAAIENERPGLEA